MRSEAPEGALARGVDDLSFAWRLATAARMEARAARARERADLESAPQCYCTDRRPCHWHAHDPDALLEQYGAPVGELLEEVASAPVAGKWHEDRARSLRRGLAPRVEECGIGYRRVQCDACGCEPRVAPVECGATLVCQSCRGRRNRRVRRKVLRAVEHHAKVVGRANRMMAGRVGRKAMRDGLAWRLRMLTLTVPHSGDVAADFDRLRRGWARMRAWLGERYAWRSPRFLAVVEVTAGAGGEGHAHLHVLTWLPWIDYDAAHWAWARAIGHEATTTTTAGKVVPSCHRPDWRIGSVKGAAAYVAKYVSKGVDAESFPLELAARWWTGTYGRRIVTTSVRFWRPWVECSDCQTLEPPWLVLEQRWPGQCWTPVELGRAPPGPRTFRGSDRSTADIHAKIS